MYVQALIQSTTLWEVYSRGSHDVSHDLRWGKVREVVMEDEFDVDLSGSPDHSLCAAVKVLMCVWFLFSLCVCVLYSFF